MDETKTMQVCTGNTWRKACYLHVWNVRHGYVVVMPVSESWSENACQTSPYALICRS